MGNNEAIVITIGDIQPIEGADRIVSAGVFLKGTKITQVIVGKDQFNEGDLAVYFDSNLCLSDDVIKQDPKLNTYLSKGNRVRCITLKNTMSNGLILPIDFFKPFVSIWTLVEGFSFTELNGTKICWKYIVSVRQPSVRGMKVKGKRKVLTSRVIPEMFKFHIDTQQLLRNAHVIKPDTVLSISRKIHGTSFVVSYTAVKRKLSFIDRIAQRIGVPVVDTEYDHLYSSRNVVKNDKMDGGFYDTDVWTHVGKKHFEFKLHAGETVYGEAYGYLPSGGMIQKPFDYGCTDGETKIAVYRITLTSADGTVAEYDWEAMKQRCVELDVPMVEEFYYGKAKELFAIPIDDNWNYNFIKGLQFEYLEKDCPYCKTKCPDEGIVIKISGLYINSYKLKSERFLLKESKLKEDEAFEDVEDTV